MAAKTELDAGTDVDLDVILWNMRNNNVNMTDEESKEAFSCVFNYAKNTCDYPYLLVSERLTKFRDEFSRRCPKLNHRTSSTVVYQLGKQSEGPVTKARERPPVCAQNDEAEYIEIAKLKLHPTLAGRISTAVVCTQVTYG